MGTGRLAFWLFLLAVGGVIVLAFLAESPPQASGANRRPAAGHVRGPGEATSTDRDPDPAADTDTGEIAPAVHHEPAVLRVIDGFGAPVQGLAVRYRTIGAPATVQTSKLALGGEAKLVPKAPWPRVEACMQLPQGAMGDADAHTPWFPLTGPTTEHRLEHVRRIEVSFVQSQTGGSMEGVRVSIRKPFRVGSDLVEVDPGRFAGRILLPSGELSGPHLEIEAPAGFRTWPAFPGSDPEALMGVLSSRARFVTATIPLYPIADVRVDVFDEDEQPAQEGVESSAQLAGVAIVGAAQPTRDELARLRLVGVPFFAEEPVRLLAWRSDPPRLGGTWVHMTRLRNDVIVGRIELQTPSLAPRLAVPPRVAPVRQAPRVPSHLVPPSDQQGALDVSVRWNQGRAVAHALVQVAGRRALTDASGACRFPGLPVGRHRVHVHKPGLLPAVPQAVEITAGATRWITVEESRGASIDLEVVDHRGRALPFAAIRPGELSRTWTGDINGRQNLGLHTDASGRRVLSRWPAGKGDLHVRWASRTTTWAFEVQPGETLVKRIYLPEPVGSKK